MTKPDEDIYNEILEDNQRGILLHQQIEGIIKNPKHPYHDSGHMDHHDAVRKVQMLHEFKHGNEPWAPEVFPVVTKTNEGGKIGRRDEKDELDWLFD